MYFESCRSKYTDKDLPIYLQIEDLMKNIIDCSYGELFIISNSAIEILKQFQQDTLLSNNLRDLSTKIIHGISGLTKLLASLQLDWKNPVLPSNKIQQKTKKIQFTSNEYVICRICDHQVPVELFQEHNKYCGIACENESKINSIHNKLISLQNQICENVLNSEWPGDPDDVVTLIPMLRASLLIEMVFHAKSNEPNTLGEIERSINIVSSLLLEIPELRNESYLIQAKSLFMKKRQSIISLQEAQEYLHRTTVSYDKNVETQHQVKISDFIFIKKISSGANARVYLARKKVTNDVYAIKVLPKNDIILKNQVKRVLVERDILLHESNVKVYVYQIAKAITFLHSCGIIHRDIKPENILVSKDGSLKLTDFGLSNVGFYGRQMNKENDNSTENLNNTVVGTPDYIAPEIVKNQRYSFSSDWWSLGIVTYELLVGVPPFHDDNETKVFTNILSGKYIYPNYVQISDAAKDFVKKLLILNPENRLGTKDTNDIFKHPFLADTNENNLIPPFVPNLKSNEDTTYFIDRYKMLNNNEEIDEDILSDITMSKKGCTQVRARSMTVISPNYESNMLDQMNAFPSVSIKMLQNANNDALKRTKSSETPEKIPLDIHKEIEKYRRKRRATFAVRSRDDSFLPQSN
ncbi:AGC family protein kinase [Histomonas meleagridis]|uniref:AGC family protein kinase n=1 Tax=Histomonas meleagridis TaxID=135588 RepID=UPI00355AB6AE|nr:AGC family protein kinase [Histomonas meleagridis]KAH0802808.1 AGC family protein kinase [Histomonas meleagridis]